METTKKRPSGRALRALTTTLVLGLLAALLLAGTALAAAKPGTPTGKTPKSTITSTKPTFSWSKAPRATKYEVRVYKGSKLQVKKTGLTRLSWKAVKTLPRNVSLSWKVRGDNARGFGAWSRSLKFKIVPSSTAKAITAFSFQGLAPPVIGTINETLHTVALTVPYGTSVTALVATFTTTGASVAVAGTPQVSGLTVINYSNPVTYTVAAADASTQPYLVTVTVAANPAKAITAFSFQGLAPPVSGTINETLHTVALTVPYGTPVSALVPTITTTGASVSPASGVAYDFTSPAIYTVTAADGTTQAYAVTVTVTLNPAKAITAFSFAAPAVTGVINETLHTIAVTVPYGTNLTALIATYTTSGASVAIAGTLQVSGLTINNFTNPVTYTVTAGDGTSQAYLVTVTVAANPAKAISAFSFASPPAAGLIDEAAHTVALMVPFGTELSGLVPTITINGASVGPASGVAWDFTSPVTYTVTAADGTTQAYVVTVTVAAPVIGQSYGGGKIAYVLQNGDPGYVAWQWRGLIAAAADQSTGTAWSTITSTLVGTTAAAIGTGQANTAAIVAQPGCTGGAAHLCYYLAEGGYSDWYLPSKDELNKLYLSRVAIGGFESDWYWWSSSEYAAGAAWAQYFALARPFSVSKFQLFRVRPVRAFPPSPAKAITAFSFTSPPATGAIDEAAHTIALTVPFGTNVSALVPTIVITGVSVSPSFGVANDFTSPRTFTVTAADGTTQAYAVTVTFAAPVIGQSYGGGKIAYVLQPGDHGYAAAQWHGLIAATADQGTAQVWSNVSKLLGGTGTALGTGDQNTKWIVAQDGCTSGAAYLCAYLVEGGRSDWYLPSKDELNKLYLNRAAIGGFFTLTDAYYWSSSEVDASSAWAQLFDRGLQLKAVKGLSSTYFVSVRAVRDF
jgi:hypothetical protein